MIVADHTRIALSKSCNKQGPRSGELLCPVSDLVPHTVFYFLELFSV